MRSLAPMTHALMALLDSMLLAGLLRAMCTLFPFTSLPHSNSPTLTQALIKSQALQEVAVVFFDPHTGAPIERVTFDVKVPICSPTPKNTLASSGDSLWAHRLQDEHPAPHARMQVAAPHASCPHACMQVADPHASCPHARMQVADPQSGGAPPPGFDIAAVESAFASTLLALSCTDGFNRPLPPGTTFEVLAYSTSRQGIDVNLFAEDSTQV